MMRATYLHSAASASMQQREQAYPQPSMTNRPMIPGACERIFRRFSVSS